MIKNGKILKFIFLNIKWNCLIANMYFNVIEKMSKIPKF